MKAYLGIDIGTSESKGALVGVDGAVLASAARPHRLVVPQPGWAEHRAEEDWWGDFVWLARKLLAKSGVAPGDIRAVGASAIGPCLLPVDAAGAPLTNAILYGVDTRAAREIADLNAAIGEATILARCGNALTSQSVGPKILWLKRERPDIFAKARKFLGATSFLVHRLTGRFVVDRYSAANVSPLYAFDEGRWSDALAPDLTPLDRLPELGWTTDIAGGVTSAAAAATGLAAGTPVIVGTIDAAAEAVSVGVLAPGAMMLMYGSTMFAIRVGATRVRDPRLWHAPWLFPGRYAALGGLATSGALTRWFADELARELDPAEAMALLASEAETSPPGARGLVALPYFSGERTPLHDPQAKGAIFGLTLAHCRADVTRALTEGIAYACGQMLATFDEAGAPPASIHAVGGGLRNRVWRQAVSDVSGLTQQTHGVGLGACYGDAFLAALALGDVAPTAIADWNPPADRIAPDPANAPIYARGAAIFRELYLNNRDLMARLGA